MLLAGRIGDMSERGRDGSPLRNDDHDASRRGWLAGLAAITVGGFGGCLDADGEDDRMGGTTEQDGTNGTVETTEPTETTGSESDANDEVHAEYDSTLVRVRSPDGMTLGEVTAAIADTHELRYLGLSDTEHLPEDRGMLFVYESVADRTFVMREMSFGIDIVYADADGTITGIHHAPAPGPDEDGNEQQYPGRGQYVLEVGYEWTAERGIEEGDLLSFER